MVSAAKNILNANKRFPAYAHLTAAYSSSLAPTVFLTARILNKILAYGELTAPYGNLCFTLRCTKFLAALFKILTWTFRTPLIYTQGSFITATIPKSAHF